MNSSRRIALSIVAMLGACGSALAQGAAGNPTSQHNIMPNTGGGWAGWKIGDTPTPSPITLDTLANPWEQVLRGSEGNPLSSSIPEGRTYAVEMYVLASGAPSWQGWVTNVITPGWEWVIGNQNYAEPSLTLDNTSTGTVENLTLAGLQRMVTSGNALRGGGLSFNFSPFAPSNPANRIFQLKGFLRYVGVNPSDPNERFTGGQIVLESAPLAFPVPAPGTAAVIGLMGLGAARRRRTVA